MEHEVDRIAEMVHRYANVINEETMEKVTVNCGATVGYLVWTKRPSAKALFGQMVITKDGRHIRIDQIKRCPGCGLSLVPQTNTIGYDTGYSELKKVALLARWHEEFDNAYDVVRTVPESL